MSSAVQVKLLTLLNVSAIKRPLTADRPGGWRSNSATPLPSPSLNHAALGSENDAESAIVPSETESGKGESGEPPKKKRRGVSFAEDEMGPSGSGVVKKSKKSEKKVETNGVAANGKAKANGGAQDEDAVSELALQVDSEEDDEASPSASNAQAGPSNDPFNTHFSVSPPQLSPATQAAADACEWTKTKKTFRGLGKALAYEAAAGKGKEVEVEKAGSTRVTPSVLERFNALHPKPSATLSSTLDIVSSYRDLFLHNLDNDADGTGAGGFGPETEAARSAATMHGLNHVLKTRRRIIRNNEKLAHAQENGDDTSGIESRDQSFTRPKMLVLVPFRSMALHYLENHLFPLAPEGTQIENHKSFMNTFGLPTDVEDPLDTAEAKANYSPDHIATFKGNSDDNFRFGIKITRKAWRVILPPAGEDKLVGCDILIASPLGIRMAADKEEGTDVLSSLEVVIADGLDVMSMQNWEHVQYAFANMNKIPNKPHGCDFSRVKPWYLDTQARFIRQTILISRYETPEIRSLFNRQLVNLAGKVRLERSAEFEGVLAGVRKGVRQVFERVPTGGRGEGNDPLAELDARFKFFTESTLPTLLKSAVSRTNTLIMVPSYFDFVRVTNYLRKMDNVSFAAISEYSSNQEISKARTAFFKGKKSFLVMTERFHFYRRYKIRGAKTIVFYSLPDHASYYSELVSFPFLQESKTSGKQTVEIDEGEVSCKVAFSKWDAMKLERVVGFEEARRMVKGDEAKYTFI